jgi:hypothetical protein
VPAQAHKSRPEPLDPWQEADPATLSWPTLEPERELPSATLPWPEAEPKRAPKQPGHKHQRPEEPSLADLDPSFAWPEGFQAQPRPDMAQEEPRKKR